MSKKKEDEKTVKEEVGKEKSKETSEEVKSKPKKSSKKSSKKTPKKTKVKKEDSKEESKVKINLPLRTLIDLVEESGIRRKDIIVRLASKGYLGQFYDEEEKRRLNYPIEPTINEDEFKKIIGE